MDTSWNDTSSSSDEASHLTARFIKTVATKKKLTIILVGYFIFQMLRLFIFRKRFSFGKIWLCHDKDKGQRWVENSEEIF